MATLKISQLSEATTGASNDYLMILQNGVNKKTQLGTVLANMNSTSNIRINPNQVAINTTISSHNFASMLFVDGVNDRIGVKTGTPAADFHVAGSIKADSVFLGSSEVVSFTTGDGSKVVSISKETTLLSVTNLNGVYTLASGFDGQTKFISLTTLTGATNAVVTCSSLVGAATGNITFTAIGQGVTLKYMSLINKWICTGNNGCTFS